MTFDEHDLRTGLRALTAAPPLPPEERITGTPRRARVQRTRRAGLAVVAACALVVPVTYVVSGSDGPRPARPATTADGLHQWPDRRNPRYRAVAELALGQHERDVERARAARSGEPFPGQPTPLPGATVRWLYADDVPGVGPVVVWARCTKERCGELVLAHLMSRESRSFHFAFVKGELPPGEPASPVGWYFPGETDGNVLFALGPPEARRLTYEVPAALGEPRRTGEIDGPAGVFAAHIGWANARPALRLLDGTGAEVVSGSLFFPGIGHAVANAKPLPPLDLPAGYRLVAGTQYQSQVTNSAGGGAFVPKGVTYTVFLRCAGGGTAHYTGGMRRSEVTQPCDGRVRKIGEFRGDFFTGRLVSTDFAPFYQVYAIALGVPDR